MRSEQKTQIPATRLRRALAEIPSVSEPIMRALIMRRKRLQRDREFAGLRVLAEANSREGHQLDDFLDKNHFPHRLVDAASEYGQTLAQRLKPGENEARSHTPEIRSQRFRLKRSRQ
jgi:thioredoxin reductase (NADPH)